jgi:hypothetical protein
MVFSGVYNVMCDIPGQTVIVSTRLSPTTIASLVRVVMGEATLVSVVEPYPASTGFVVPGTRYAYDDMYTYPSYTGYGIYDPYKGRSYDTGYYSGSYY